ncbi:MAG: DUF222 domain-containing protein, partial [Streptosporangiaceae bacterium]
MPVDAQPATSFVIDLDLAGMLVGLGIDCGAPEDQDAVFAAEQEALARCPVPPAAVPGRGCEVLPTGAGLAAWLESAVPDRCAGADLPDIACAYRRLASWAQAQELAAVAEIAARTAARRGRGDDDPWVVPEAAAQVGLALTMSQPTAAEWTCLGTRLRRQLTGTAGALSAGQIDLTRARLIAEATVALPDETARAVEARVLAAAGEQTSGQLRASLRRAVIAADPDGADRRRERAERHARVSLYPDADGTATLTGAGLPAVTAAAAMARITAMARAMKTAGQSGGLDYLRAYVMLGLLLGTLPLIPPPPGAPPDEPPPDEPPPDEPPPDEPPDRAPPDDAGGQPASPDPDLPPPPDEPPDLHDPEPAASGAESRDPGDSDEAISPGVAPPAWPPLPAGLPGPVRYPSAGEASGRAPPGLLDVLLPWSALIGAARAEPAVLGRIGPVTPHQKRQLVDLAASHPGTQWRVILTDD